MPECEFNDNLYVGIGDTPYKVNTFRYRVSVSQTSTGKFSWDTTAEGVGMTKAEVLAESDALVAELKKRYQAEIKEK